MPAGLRRARRSAAVARATLALSGALIIADAPVAHHPVLELIGFAIIFATALVQLIAPRAEWIKIEESLAPVSAILIVGLGPERITAPWLLWLVAVACGVLARGGRVFWIGRAMLLASLALPIVRHGEITLTYACVCFAAIALLLVCGRVTQELRAMLDKARHDADHDGLTGALSRAAFHRALDAFLARGGDGAVILLDLDNFGAINKSAGHAAGDTALRRVVEHMDRLIGDAGILVPATRSPVAGPEARATRWSASSAARGWRWRCSRSSPCPRAASTPTRRWPASAWARTPTRCTGLPWPTSSPCATGSSSPACARA